jgi:predicted cupin superfamily sugar epimerase
MIDLRDPAVDAGAVREALGLAPHPEGGAYREIWRDAPPDGGRGAATSILFLLAAGEISHWHRVDAAELWLWQAGAPLRLEIAECVQKPSLRGAEGDEAIRAAARSQAGLLRSARNDGRGEFTTGNVARLRLGPDLGAGETVQGIVPAGAWQAARSLGAWTLVSCVVAPAFQFSGFELAPPGWSPGG